jgi:hypothetical protein
MARLILLRRASVSLLCGFDLGWSYRFLTTISVGGLASGGGTGASGVGSQKGEFAHGKVDPSEAGKKGRTVLH